jgi:hypothetical protein
VVLLAVVVASCFAITGDTPARAAISEFVDSSFKAMPAHLRLGVVVESIGLGAWVRLRYLGNPSAAQIRAARVARERRSRPELRAAADPGYSSFLLPPH